MIAGLRSEPPMSMFGWMNRSTAPAPLTESSGLSRVDPTRPAGRNSQGKDSGGNARPANRKAERIARRELLYVVVRESMERAAMLSTSYKFKVLSLDSAGRSFLVMVDLARGRGGETSELAEIEVLIAQSAKARHDIVVTAVYWRWNEHVAVGNPKAASPLSAPAPAAAPNALAAHAGPKPQPVAAGGPASGSDRAATHDRIQPAELEEFERALAALGRRPGSEPDRSTVLPSPEAAAASARGASARSFDGTRKHGPQSYTLLTGFEDTEEPEHFAPLSGTQYGDLR